MPIELKPLAPRDAIRALEARGTFVPSFAWQEIYGAQHAAMFTVAKSAGFDILDDIYAGLQDALAEGKTFRQFAAELTPLLQERGWWGRQRMINPTTGLPEIAQLGSPRRLRIIFDANMRASYAAGHWASFERNKSARPFLRYVHLEGQEHPRLHHKDWHNTVLPVAHPWWITHGTPNGWNCHCTIQSLSQRDVDRLLADGVPLRFEPPADRFRRWTNKVTGEERDVPDGIDPGWDHNPGRSGAEAAANRMLAEHLVGVADPIMDGALAERLASEAFARFVNDPVGLMPVFTLPEEIARTIGLQSRLVLLSEQTMQKQLLNHPELTLVDYRALAQLGQRPTLVVQDGAQTIALLLEADGSWRYAVVKATATGKAAFLTSYRRARDANVRRLLAGTTAKILIDRR